MRVLIGRMSDGGRFAEEAPVPDAEIVTWTEPRSGGVIIGQGRQPDVPTRCRAWAVEVRSLEHLVELLADWRIDHAASVELEVRERGRSDVMDLQITLLDDEGPYHLPTVVEDLP